MIAALSISADPSAQPEFHFSFGAVVLVVDPTEQPKAR
jgi:hypothetical protein